MLVLKFGGTSVGSAESIESVKTIISDLVKTENQICVVVSAFSGITDTLLKACDAALVSEKAYREASTKIFDKASSICSDLLSGQSLEECIQEITVFKESLNKILFGVSLLKEASPRTKDLIVSFGERISATVINYYFNLSGLKSRFVDARMFLKTNKNYGSAFVHIDESYSRISKHFKTFEGVSVTTGFIASDIEDNTTTTLGRGGSDYTASLFAAALDARELQIWTDVSGVLSSDPRKVKKAYTIKELSYNEALELSHFGAKVLYAPTIRPVREKNIATRIKNTFAPSDEGTLIHSGKSSKSVIAGISAIENISILTLEGTGMQGVTGTASRLFEALALEHINVIMITQASSEHSISIALKDFDANLAKSLIENAFIKEIEQGLIDPVRIDNDMCLLAMVGENMKNQPGVAGKLFQILGNNGINIEAIAQGSSELNISFAVSSKDHIKALNTIHDAFFLSTNKTIHLFIVGVGLVGGCLMELIKKNKDKIKSQNKLDIVVNAISNSRQMMLSNAGISLDEYESLMESGEKADMSRFVEFMVNSNLSNSIFIDNTAGSAIPKKYAEILSHSIAISTPNKLALSSDYESYLRLKSIAERNNTSINFETNVGAGLPVISTLHNLVKSGDRIQKIEAILSGSLSYIFNNYDGSLSFSALVKKAKQEGFTEPDPRDDLSGLDARRKLLILARESGYPLEAEDIEIEKLLPDDLMEMKTTVSFLQALATVDSDYAKLLDKARRENKRLRYIAQFAGNKGKIGLQMVSESSPFFNLAGSDNMIAFYSDRYEKNPLIVRGPGAGAEVTAAGILAELINIGSK